MPADYSPVEPPRRQSPSQSPASSSSPSPRISPEPSVRWTRRHLSPSRRLSDARMRNRSRYSPRDMATWAWKETEAYGEWVRDYYFSLSPTHRVAAAVGCALIFVLGILSLVYSHRFFAWLGPIAKSWRELRAGWLISFALVFITSFPPIIGYSTANTIAGFVYGVKLGWPIVASACTLGSLCAFLASRTVFSNYVHRMVGKDHRFVALGQVLRRDGILYLTAIRFCPLPFSLSNGFLATIPSITPLAFTVSTALSTPKLFIHVFIGSRLAILAEDGEKMTAGDKAINYLGMAIGGAIGLAVGIAIYRRTMARAAELAMEEDAAIDAAEHGEGGYEDTDATLLDPEDAAAAMSDDDISLWDTQGNDDWDAYNDETDDSESQKKTKGPGYGSTSA